jgi:hypothetical protein
MLVTSSAGDTWRVCVFPVWLRAKICIARGFQSELLSTGSVDSQHTAEWVDYSKGSAEATLLPLLTGNVLYKPEEIQLHVAVS